MKKDKNTCSDCNKNIINISALKTKYLKPTREERKIYWELLCELASHSIITPGVRYAEETYHCGCEGEKRIEDKEYCKPELVKEFGKYITHHPDYPDFKNTKDIFRGNK